MYHMYLFHLTVLLNPDFNISNNLFSFSVDKVMTGTYSLQSVILNVASVGDSILATAAAVAVAALVSLYAFLTKTLLSVQLNSIDVSQLINGTFKFLQKLPKCFNGMASSMLVPVFLPSAKSGNGSFKLVF